MLSIRIKTVDRHRANMLEKLGMRDRVELTRYAIRRGLIEPCASPSWSPEQIRARRAFGMTVAWSGQRRLNRVPRPAGDDGTLLDHSRQPSEPRRDVGTQRPQILAFQNRVGE